MTMCKKEILVQGALISKIGKELYESLSKDKQAKLNAKWRDLINDWEAKFGDVPTEEQLEWIFGIWCDCEPRAYIERLLDCEN
jgi:hypothetical protein